MRTPALAGILVLSTLTLALAPQGHAVETKGRVLGVGALTQFSSVLAGDPPAQLSLKLTASPRLEAGVLFGINTASHSATFLPGVKVFYVLIPEDKMNLYVAGGMSLNLNTDNGLQAFLWQVGPGLEFYFSEFPHVGFSFEFGLGGAVPASGFTIGRGLATTMTSVGGAGIHYYF